jgi:hypothetical protein
MGLSVIARNPLSIVTGSVTSQNYLERYQPGYAHALQMVSQTSLNSKVYSLFEPRTYGMNRNIQPDPILDNFSHDLYLYGDPENMINAWRLQGYTYILLNIRGANFILQSTTERAVLDKIVDLLKPISISQDGNYELLEIPIHQP